MKVAVVTYHLPHPHGTATGRHVFAVWEEARRLGHEVQAWAWGTAPDGLQPPEWVEHRPFHDPGGLRGKPSTVRRPRWGLAAVGWRPPPDAVAWAEEPESYAAVAPARDRGLVVPHSAWLDAVALRQVRPATVQSVRAERRAVGGAGVAVTLSSRIAARLGIDYVVPVTQPIPAEPLPGREEPAVLLLADWDWPPNQVALARLLAGWPLVRRRVPEARLLVAGRGRPATGSSPGVEVIGPVIRARDAMERAAVLAFPCPPTSGPKMKVLDALAHGLPVVTTAAGVEGLQVSDRTVAVAAPSQFAETLVAVLLDPRRRRRMAAEGRDAVLQHHSPARAAAARLALLEPLLSR